MQSIPPVFRSFTLAVVALVTVGLFASSVSAMTILKAPLRDLVNTSELVIHAKVKRTQVLDKRAKGLAVFTKITLDVIELYKGDRNKVGATFSWEMVGGTAADGMTWSVPGMPSFTKGEEVVVLLEKHARGYTLTGAPQGKYVVFRDAKNIARVHRSLGDVHMFARDSRGRLTEVKHTKALPLLPPRLDPTLNALRAEIRTYVRMASKTPALRGRVAPRKALGRAKR